MNGDGDGYRRHQGGGRTDGRISDGARLSTRRYVEMDLRNDESNARAITDCMVMD